MAKRPVEKKEGNKVESTKQQPASLSSQSVPLIFISHDARDAELAQAFSKLLKDVSAGVLRSFISSDKKGKEGIEYGAEWYPYIMESLNKASDVVCLLTQRSLDRPWILYEAGVAKGKLDTLVYCVAFGLPLSKAYTGPFALFQNCEDDEESLTKLVMQLLARIPGSSPEKDAVLTQVKAFKQKAESILRKITKESGTPAKEAKVDEATVAKLFEEVKIMFQELPSRIEDRVDPNRRRRLRRFHPMMIEELMHMSGEMNEPLGLLVAISFFRDEMPWLYEVGLEVYKATKSGDPVEIEKAIRALHTVQEFMRMGPFMEEFAFSKESYMMLRELPMMIEKYAQRCIPKKTTRKKAIEGN